jgi:hypothetical protein
MNLQELQTAYAKGERFKFLFFWGHQKSKDGTISASCLSQWWVLPFTVDQNEFQTAEHWMMYQKAILFEDLEIAEKVLMADSPEKAKELGRQVKNFDPNIWDQRKFEIVVNGNVHKFGQHPDYMTFLLNTKNRVLVEASPRDRIWGIGMDKNNENVENPLLWKGQNLLGFALMEAREKLMKNESN